MSTADAEPSPTRRPDHPPVWLDNAGVAERYGMSLSTVRGWRRKRMGPPAHKIGGRVLYRLDELEEWEAAHADERSSA